MCVRQGCHKSLEASGPIVTAVAILTKTSKNYPKIEPKVIKMGSKSDQKEPLGGLGGPLSDPKVTKKSPWGTLGGPWATLEGF